MRTRQQLCFLTAALVLLLFSFASHGEGRPFITRWKGEKGKVLEIPINGKDYKLVIKRASDNAILKTEPSLTIEKYKAYKFTPTEDGELLVEAGPVGVTSFQMWESSYVHEQELGTSKALLRVEQFGTVQWQTMKNAFRGCKNLQFAAGIDTPDLSKVTDMSNMFYGCTSFNQPLNNWNVSQVTDMSGMFYGCTSFNQPLNNWDVSQVQKMSDMGYFYKKYGMFSGCTSFNQPLNNWNVSKVTDMGSMFDGCTSFNQPLNNWNVSKVTGMSYMFSRCTSFNQPLNNWNVSQVKYMHNMFRGCTSFNQDLGMWKLEECEKLSLDGCGMSVENYSKSLVGWAAQTNIKQGLDLSVRRLKYNASGKAARVKLISEKSWRIFGDSDIDMIAKPFITRWKGEQGKRLKIPISGNDYKLVIKRASDGSVLVTKNDCYDAYSYTPSEDGELLVEAGPDGVTSPVCLYQHNGSAEALLRVEQFGTVQWETMWNAFHGCKNMQFAEGIDTPDLSQVTNMSNMFSGCTSFNQPLNNWNVSKVTSMRDMFSGCTSFNQPLNNWNVSKVTSMRDMFSGCTSFNQSLNNWDVSKVTDMGSMFSGCTSFNQSLNNWDVSKVTDMGSMFDGCTSFNQPLNNWNVSNVRDMSEMFKGCTSFNQSLNNWDVSKVTSMRDMFSHCISFNQPLNNWNVSQVQKMGDIWYNNQKYGMFYGCTSFNQPLNNWDVSQVTDMSGMFAGCTSFDQDLGMWKLEKCQKLGLDNCGMSVENYSKSLVGWAAQNDISTGLQLNVKGLKYTSEATTARNTLLIGKSWRITGDALLVLSFGTKKLSLIQGAEHTLELTKEGIDESETVTLTSSAPTTVQIIDAASLKIKGVKAGTATITATVPANGRHGELIDRCEVTVTVPATGITLSQTELQLIKGASAILTATVVPADATNQKVMWSSNNPSVATVENGTVTAVSAGNATITVTTEDGNHTAACEVTVTVPATGITLSQTELPLVKGASAILTATVAPSDATNQKVVWSSNNPSVATVENGTVTAVSGGNATITVTTEDGNHTATCEVTVTVPATGITLSQTELPLVKGASAILTATVAPPDATNQKVVWSSDNAAVATVSDAGLVEAKAVGVAVITVTTQEGAFTATCEVTVTEEDVVLTGLRLSPSETRLKVGGEATLSVTYEPAGATQREVTWRTSDAAIVTVDEHGKVKAIAAGEATITVASKTNASIQATCKVIVEPATAVEDAVFASVVIAPNPFGNQLRIVNGDLRGTYVLLNAQGVVVRSGNMYGREVLIETSDLTSGLYLLRLTAANGATKTITVVKER